MDQTTVVKDLTQVTIRLSGDSGDGMQLSGTLFSTLSAVFGNEIATFPDYPSEIRAPQGTLSGVSGFQVRIGSKNIHTAGDLTDVLIAMNPAALKANAKHLRKNSIVIFDTDSFNKRDLEKADFITDDPFKELGMNELQLVPVPITSMTKESLMDMGLDNKAVLRSKNMFALGLVCWLLNRPVEIADKLLEKKFSKKPKVVEANVRVLNDGYNYGNNRHLTVSTYRIEALETSKGFYTDINGNLATAYGLIAGAEKANIDLLLGSYPITPATDILHELAKRKDFGIKALQMEDEIAGICAAIGASFAGRLGVTTTSGPGLALKGEALGLAVMAELPLVVIDVQRGGPSTGIPTKSEQSDLNQALYGRNGESPVVVIAALSPTDCFDSAFWATKLTLEHITPVVLLTDGYIANGSSSWKIPKMSEYPDIKPNYVENYKGDKEWMPYLRDEETKARYWAFPGGKKGYAHRLGGLEKDAETGVISSNPENHQLMVETRQAKIDKIADYIPELEVIGDEDADTIIVGWGGTFGHLLEAYKGIKEKGHKIAFTQFKFIAPLPKNTEKVLRKYSRIIVAEQNLGQFANYLNSQIKGLNIHKYNRITGQPFLVWRLIEEFINIIEEEA
ncbi:MAG TPA: 2-oxoacid:acceptor oxidoreductase subunit alpha [Dysgonamonadaceae bacterium]|nr:2-oxoacid:acceptor oxidoreductase subunit alpha [Dysgonamonadaceae bacterium]